jgi:thiamine biosynthesis lipoprotein
MATRFEIVLHGNDPVALRAAGEEALAEIERLEAQLSLYRTDSEIAHLNARAASQPVRVTPGLLALLEHAQKLHQESGGAFDITIGPLVRCWGFMGGEGCVPSDEELAVARSKTGMHLVNLHRENFTVSFSQPGVMLDLGAIGKGYAIECAAEILREAGVSSALIHGGTSTAYGLGKPPEAESWNVAIENPQAVTSGEWRVTGSGNVNEPLAVIPLRDEALSVSAVWGKSFQSEGRTLGHVLDPRTGWPTTGALLAAVVLPSATETDALSTALLVLGKEGHETISRLRPEMRTVLVTESGNGFAVEMKNLASSERKSK